MNTKELKEKIFKSYIELDHDAKEVSAELGIGKTKFFAVLKLLELDCIKSYIYSPNYRKLLKKKTLTPLEEVQLKYYKNQANNYIQMLRKTLFEPRFMREREIERAKKQRNIHELDEWIGSLTPTKKMPAEVISYYAQYLKRENWELCAVKVVHNDILERNGFKDHDKVDDDIYEVLRFNPPMGDEK